MVHTWQAFPQGAETLGFDLGSLGFSPSTVGLYAADTATFPQIGARPSYRQLVDLAAPEASRWIIAGGVSGDPRSRHYADQLPQWLEGDTRPMRFLEMPGPGDRALRLVPADCAASSCVL